MPDTKFLVNAPMPPVLDTSPKPVIVPKSVIAPALLTDDTVNVRSLAGDIPPNLSPYIVITSPTE